MEIVYCLEESFFCLMNFIRVSQTIPGVRLCCVVYPIEYLFIQEYFLFNSFRECRFSLLISKYVSSITHALMGDFEQVEMFRAWLLVTNFVRMFMFMLIYKILYLAFCAYIYHSHMKYVSSNSITYISLFGNSY